jgi:outer membrane autotransporter protein
MLGFALAGGGTSWSLSGALGGGKSDMFQAGLYGSTRAGPAYLSAALAYSTHWVSTDRTVTAGLTERLRADFVAHAFGARLESGYRFGAGFGVTPYAAMQVQGFNTPAYAEHAQSGTGTFALSYDADNKLATRSELGARFDSGHVFDDGTTLTLRSRAAWAHAFNADRSLSATFQTLPGARFPVTGALPADDALLVSAAAELRFAGGWSVAGRFDGEFAGGSHVIAGSGTLRYAW